MSLKRMKKYMIVEQLKESNHPQRDENIMSKIKKSVEKKEYKDITPLNQRNYHKINDITNKKFGRLIVESFAWTNYRQKSYWNCTCECGNKLTVLAYSLTSGHTKSCGCYSYELILKRITKHGMCYHPMNKTWRTMKQRCYNKKCKAYKDYGGRGIKVCDRWLNSFENFYKDMGNRPLGMELDRIDNDGNYESNNCRWVIQNIQDRNKRSNVMVTYIGKTQCLQDWSKELNICRSTLQHRIQKLRLSPEIAFNVPIGKKFNNKFR